MKKNFTVILIWGLVLSSCGLDKNDIQTVQYNLIEPNNGIYVVIQKDVEESKLNTNNYEAVFYNDDKVIRIERYNTNQQLSDEFSVAAITSFEYDLEERVKTVMYFDSNKNKVEDELFGYWSIEYIYDEMNRVRMEIYRNANSEFLKIPRDNEGNIAKENFISPVLTYEYVDDKLKIKALDKNFNLLKEVIGDKPCIPFIDCGEND